MPAELLVSARNLYCSYAGIRAVDDATIEVHGGEVLGLLGPNGAGKTTTLEVISGVRPPDAGRVSIGEHDILDRPKAAKALLGYLPERPPLLRELTVDEFLRYCARLRGVPRSGLAVATEQAKERCGLGDVGGRLIGHLSQGYQQRVGIAQAIVHGPRVAILDEPTVGLDPHQVRDVRALIRDLARDHAVILSTHILPEVRAVCTRVQIMHRGRTVLNESMEVIDAGSPRPTRAAFRRPPTTAVLAALSPVAAVSELGPGRFRLTPRPDGELAEAVTAASVEGGWGLYELAPEGDSMEETFIALTSGDESTRGGPQIAPVREPSP